MLIMTETKNSPNPLPQAVLTVTSELPDLHSGMVENALSQALPLPDLMFGGGMLVLVIMFHAFWIRFITGVMLKRGPSIRSRGWIWHADLLFVLGILSLLAVHLSEVLLWSTALVVGDIVDDWARAAYFAANCYTALGEPFSLPHAWRMLPPIIAISGIFTFAWTASVLVDFVARYNTLRADILARRHRPPDARKNSP
jgi:hypothetical protein